MNEEFLVKDRRSIRLSGYDYTREGAYFITICTQDRADRFGAITDGTIELNDVGRMVQNIWIELPTYYPGVDIDAFVVMPDHIHGIIILTRAESVGAGLRACPFDGNGQPQGVAPTETAPPDRLSLPDVVHRFKSLTTARYRAGVQRHDWPAFDGRLWQRNYHEHIIRDDAELTRIRRYIADNPARLHSDCTP